MEGERLDIALAKMLPDLSRSKLTAFIKSGEALIYGKKFKPKDKVNGGEIVFLSVNHNQNSSWSAEDIPINIIFEDDDIMVINKEFGLVTHPGSGNWSGTLANALLNYDPNLEALDRAGIVHRLDKNTSGLMVVAKNQKSQKYLVEQLQTHSVSREYSAIVYGHMIAGGTINLKLKRANHRTITRSRTVSSRIDKAYHLFEIGRDLLKKEIKDTNFYRLLGIGVNNIGKASEARLFDLLGGEDDKRNRLELAVDDLHSKMGKEVLYTGRQFTKNLRQKK